MRAAVFGLCLWAGACGDDRAAPRPQAPDAAAVDLTCPVRGERVVARLIAKLEGGVMQVTSAPGDPRLYAVEQAGRVWILDGSSVRSRPLVDLRDDVGGPVRAGGEQGLLGLAFHPRYAENRRVFVFYTTRSANVLAEYAVGPDDVVDPASARVLLSIADRFSNHNGGMIAFSPDGKLLIGTGDGGSANDPDGNGQDRFALLGKLLRIDIDRAEGGRPYGIPPDNPYADGVAGAPEVYTLGLRNPWRWSFDGEVLYLADVGQDRYEELTIVSLAAARGANLGWFPYEAQRCGVATGCTPDGFVFPQVVRNHGNAPDAGWCSIIGGAVYRGSCFPDLVGRYFYTDYCRGGLYSLRYVVEGGGGRVVEERVEPGEFPSGAASISSASGGELFLTTTAGGIYRLEAQP